MVAEPDRVVSSGSNESIQAYYNTELQVPLVWSVISAKIGALQHVEVSGC